MAKLHISCIDILNLLDDKDLLKIASDKECVKRKVFICVRRVRRYYESSCILFVIDYRNHLAQLSLPWVCNFWLFLDSPDTLETGIWNRNHIQLYFLTVFMVVAWYLQSFLTISARTSSHFMEFELYQAWKVRVWTFIEVKENDFFEFEVEFWDEFAEFCLEYFKYFKFYRIKFFSKIQTIDLKFLRVSNLSFRVWVAFSRTTILTIICPLYHS